jgi:hypothetical protein
LGKKYVFAANPSKLEAITLESDGKGGAVTLAARVDGLERRIVCGRGAWQKGRVAWAPAPEQPVAAGGAWTADDTFTAKLCFYETPYIATIRLKFSGRQVEYNAESNVSFGPTKEPQLVGRAE